MKIGNHQRTFGKKVFDVQGQEEIGVLSLVSSPEVPSAGAVLRSDTESMDWKCPFLALSEIPRVSAA
jgi:hypothetical protein